MFSNKKRKLERLNSGISDSISAQSYNLVLGLCVLYGILMNVITVSLFSSFFMGINAIVIIVGYFILCLLGMFLAASRSPVVSFIGYNLIVVPVGILLSTCLPAYAFGDIVLSIILTGVIVIAMVIASTAFPKFFSKIGPALFITLLISIIVECISLLLGYRGAIFDYIVVTIFSLYVGYDWYKAQAYPKTLNNAIDSAIDIYLDVINLFVRILSILNRDDD